MEADKEKIVIQELPFNGDKCMIRIRNFNNIPVAATYIAIRQAFCVEISGLEVPALEVFSYHILK